MTDSNPEQESWTLEVVLSIVVGLPWYFFSGSAPAAIAIHCGLVLVYFIIVTVVFGRGSAIMSFLLVLTLSFLAGILAIGFTGGRLFL
jgi:hypothetical protein